MLGPKQIYESRISFFPESNLQVLLQNKIGFLTHLHQSFGIIYQISGCGQKTNKKTELYTIQPNGSKKILMALETTLMLEEHTR